MTGTNTSPIGTIENAIIQHNSVRCVHGWMLDDAEYKYICVFHPLKPFLYKIIYQYSRQDLLNFPQPSIAFLAEIVYGADLITSALTQPTPPNGLILRENYTQAGWVECEPPVFAALTRAAAQKGAPK